VLPGISTEQLRSRLNRMVADGMLTRKRYREVPPRVDYELTERARELMPILGELARWGYEWAWSPPRASESVDLGAIFRLAPGLLRRAGSMRPDAAPAGTPHTDPTAGHVAAGGPASGAAGLPIATVEFVVEDPERPGDYTFTMSDEGVNLEEHAAGGADARVAGSTEAWVKAFSPERDRSGLDIAGDQQLAESLLDGLAAVGRRAAARAAQAA
jgi:hypothetical protein